MSELIYSLKGEFSDMDVYNDHVTIKGKKGINGFFRGTLGNGEKDYYYADLSAVQYKKRGKLTTGFIKFEQAGSAAYRGWERGADNSFIISLGYVKNEDAKKAYDYIMERFRYYKENSETQVVNNNEKSPVEQLKEMKELLDMGIVTEEEFDKKKKELLGL